MLLGIRLAERGDLAGAEREIETALTLERDDTSTSEGWNSIKIYSVLARLYDASGDKAKSEAILKRMQSTKGGSPAAELLRTDLKLSHGDAPGAGAMARQLSIAYPYDPRVWVELGLALIAQKRDSEALAAFQRALSFAPRDTAVNYLTAVTLYRLGRNREALDQCRRVLAVAPDDPGTRALMARIEHDPRTTLAHH
ncbi:MAG: tetratricopeptide repeat protein [Candidatus Binataceae bacterium]